MTTTDRPKATETEVEPGGQRAGPPRPGRSAATLLVVVGLIGLTALATVLVEHKIHEDEHGGEDHDEHGGDEHDGDEHDEHDGDEHDEDDGDEHDEHDEEDVESVEISDAQLAEADVILARAAAGKVVVSVDLPGEIAFNGEAMAHVGPRAGGTVRSIDKKLGDQVVKGDILAVLDSADVAEMQGAVEAARERLALAAAEFERKKKLFDEKITSERDFLAAKHAHAEAQVELRSAQRGLGAKTGGSGAGGGYALVAPLSGTIVGWHLGVGEVLEEKAVAFTIADLSSVWVNVTVYAKDLPRVRMGQRAMVRAEGIEEPAEGRISYLSHTVGELTRSATARIVLDAPGEAWRPGLFVTAEVEIDEVEATVVVPETAVQRYEGKHVVFVRHESMLEARPVALGRHGHSMKTGTAGDDRVVEITKGLEAGEQYVSKNSFLIKADMGKASAGHQH